MLMDVLSTDAHYILLTVKHEDLIIDATFIFTGSDRFDMNNVNKIFAQML